METSITKPQKLTWKKKTLKGHPEMAHTTLYIRPKSGDIQVTQQQELYIYIYIQITGYYDMRSKIPVV